jgi:ribonuclease VapC
MVIDSSAIMAILLGEPEAKSFFYHIAAARFRCMTAPMLLEAMIVAKSSKGTGVLPRLELLLDQLDITVLDFTSEHANVAKLAFVQFGKGQGSPARLNFGDCMSYASAKVEAMPLLFKGNDFRFTDVECAL